MASEVETEFKFGVADASAFAALCTALDLAPDAGRTARQVNHFFDGAGMELRRAGIALRLREEDGSWRLTVKGAEQPSGDGVLTERMEIELAVDPAVARDLLSGARSPREVLAGSEAGRRAEVLLRGTLGDAPVAPVGSFENERRRLPEVTLAGQPLVFELDRTRFDADHVDHEIEVECRSRGAAELRGVLEALLAGAGIEWHAAGSKAKRFFALLDRDPT